MITRVSGLAIVLALTLVVSAPALAAKPIPGYPDFEITARGNLIHERDVILGNCDDTESFLWPDKSLREQAAGACEKAEQMALLADTGGPPIILIPVALLVAGGLLIRKSTAL